MTVETIGGNGSTIYLNLQCFLETRPKFVDMLLGNEFRQRATNLSRMVSVIIVSVGQAIVLCLKLLLISITDAPVSPV